MNSYWTSLYIWIVFRVVDKDSNTFWANFLGSVSKHKKHRINHIAFSTAIWTNNGGETFVKWPQHLFPSITLEIDVVYVCNDQSWTIGLHCACWCWRRRNVNIPNTNSTCIRLFLVFSIVNFFINNVSIWIFQLFYSRYVSSLMTLFPNSIFNI